MKSRSLIILATLALSLPATSQTLSLEECRSIALKNNKQASIAAETKLKAQYEEKSYKANYFPKFSASGTYLYTDSEMKKTIPGGYLPTYIPDPGGSGELIPNILTTTPEGTPVFKEYALMPDMNFELKFSNTFVAGVSAEQPVYMGGKISAAHKLSRLGTELASLNVKLTNNDIVVATDEAFWMHVRAKEMLKTAEKYRELLTELNRMVTNAHKAGVKQRNDVLKVQVKLNEAELQVLKAENAVKLSRMNLAHVIGLPLTSEINVAGVFEVAPIEATYRPEVVESRPEYGMMQKQVDMQTYQTRLAQSDFLPNVGVRASYNYGYGLKLNDERLLDNTSFSAVLSVSIPIFQWGEGRNKVRAAQTQKRITQLQRDDIADQLRLDLQRSLQNYQESLHEVSLMMSSVTQAEENMKVSRNMYDNGKETLSDLLEAQALCQNAWANLVNAKAQLKLSETNLLKASGKLEF